MQANSIEVDLAWLAGFMDGEGTFILMKVSGRYPQPTIAVNNTHYGTLPEMTALLDRLNLPYYVGHKNPPTTHKGWSPQWTVQAIGLKRCDRWCRALLPYLKTKREACELMLEYINRRLLKPLKGAWGERILDAREQQLVNLLNKGRRRPGSGRPRKDGRPPALGYRPPQPRSKSPTD